MAKRRKIGGAILTAALVVTIVTTGLSSAGAHHLERFTQAGECAEYYAAAIPVDADLAQAQLPSGFTVLDVGGSAVPFVFVMHCTASIDGKRPVRSVISGVAVFVDPVRSPGGCQIYDWEWQESRRSRWLRAMNDLGIPMTRVRGNSFSLFEYTYRASVPARLAPWSASATGTTVGQDPAAAPVVSVHYHLGPRGLVRSTYNHDFIENGTAIGPVTLGNGSLWRALDANSQDAAAGLTLRFSWEGVTELI